jgi:hypothetical protein
MRVPQQGRGGEGPSAQVKSESDVGVSHGISGGIGQALIVPLQRILQQSTLSEAGRIVVENLRRSGSLVRRTSELTD